MNGLLPPGPLLAAFVLASLLLAVTPGPAVFYIVTRSLAQGRRAGLASVAGVAMGNFGNALGASVGLAALFAVSSAAFTVVRLAGALYLIYLGGKALRAPTPPADGGPGTTIFLPAPPRRVFRDGFVVALLNPKTAVFFAAFLPQFMGNAAAGGPGVAQSALLGAMFVLIAGTTDTAYALAAGTVGPALSQSRRLRAGGRYLTGGAFIGLGLFTAFAGARRAK